MAYKFELQADSEIRGYGIQAGHFWNLTFNVGWGCENYPPDVQMVQYMLQSIYYDLPSAVSPTPYNPIDIDGKYGPQTCKWIKEFQRNWVQTTPSGKITRGDGLKYYASPGKRYTIYLLNTNYKKVRGFYYEDLRSDPELPTELCVDITGGGAGYSELYN
jgi:hypothetical protein